MKLNIATMQAQIETTQAQSVLADFLRDYGVAEGNILIYQSIIGLFLFILALALAELLFRDTFLVMLVAVVFLAVECILLIFPLWVALLAGIVAVMYVLVRGI